MDIERARVQLGGSPIGHTIIFQAQTTSTMDDARALAQEGGVASGTVFVADAQTQGRGRLARTWQAPAGAALLMSVLLHGGHIPGQPGLLPAAAGLAVVEAIRASAGALPPAGLKWPNDVLVGHEPVQARKVAGILVESSFSGGAFAYAIIGVGVNVRQAADELPAVTPPAPQPTSLALEFGQPAERATLLVAICRALGHTLALPAAALLGAWRAELWTLGRPVEVHQPRAAPLHALAVDVDGDGALVVEDTGGRRHVVRAGDVSVRSG